MNFGVTRKKQEELEARMAALGVREADIEEKYVRSSGPGGVFQAGLCARAKYCYIQQKFLTYCAVCISFLGSAVGEKADEIRKREFGGFLWQKSWLVN